MSVQSTSGDPDRQPDWVYDRTYHEGYDGSPDGARDTEGRGARRRSKYPWAVLVATGVAGAIVTFAFVTALVPQAQVATRYPATAVITLSEPDAQPAALIAALVTLVTALLSLAVVVAAGPYERRDRRDRRYPGGVADAPARMNPGDPALTSQLGQLQRQHAQLVRGVADLIGQLPDELSWQASNALVSGGVHPLVPDGERFDPTRHQAVGTVAAGAVDRVDTIARTIRPGYADDRQVFVPARVVVYTAGTAR